MKITPKILSIPFYISTSWTQIRGLYMQQSDLVISLIDGTTIAVPELKPEEIEAIFHAHATFIENSLTDDSSEVKPPPFFQMPNTKLTPPHLKQNAEKLSSMQLHFDNIELFSSALHHNPEQAHAPNFPPEILKKIAAIAKIVAPDDIQKMPKPEPFCNCPHCQITRAIQGEPEEEKSTLEQKEEEIVGENDLGFQQWEIKQTGDKLYCVANRLDMQEKYSVYLGHPVGCTCGASGCEHILAVLKS